ncbi:hypothetical protein M011DRAFT_380965, partial [Sporormia fimetaria CBS 119925]
WQLTCLLFAVTASSQLTFSNEPRTNQTYNGVLELLDQAGNRIITHLQPITPRGYLANGFQLSGNLFNTNESTVDKLPSKDIAYISCDPSAYGAPDEGTELLKTATERYNPTAVILYAIDHPGCAYDGTINQEAVPIYTMTNMTVSKQLLDKIDDIRVADKYFVTIRTEPGTVAGGGGGTGQPSKDYGPSPSTAVAMIILYSITGVITALFLAIIVVGAVRAHRHPDRYGAPEVTGRPGQTRVRRLGRAILDTIPIVKFGEREPAKPADVEVATTELEEIRPPQAHMAREQPSGIASALPASTPVNPTATVNDEDKPGCSICTEDFEQGQDIRVLPCNHKYHPECVDPWLLNVSGTCPLCRVDLRPSSSRSGTSRDSQQSAPGPLPPPLQPETEMSHRRRSALSDML